MSKKVLCFGEVLWDLLPKGMFLGGAPLNVALNLSNLGVPTTIISAVGDDEKGRLAIQAIRDKGMASDFIQINDNPTGIVDVEIDETGNPSYTIHAPAAWDFISYSEQVQDEINSSAYVVIGTLIFRNEISANSIKKALDSYQGKIVVDMNFREPFYNRELVAQVMDLADIVKVNYEELEKIAAWEGKDLPYKKILAYLCKKYNLELILLTRGEKGSALHAEGKYFEKAIYQVQLEDPVGAGDAFLAGVIYSLWNNNNYEDVLCFANAIGAYVASQKGATPKPDLHEINRLMQEA